MLLCSRAAHQRPCHAPTTVQQSSVRLHRPPALQALAPRSRQSAVRVWAGRRGRQPEECPPPRYPQQV